MTDETEVPVSRIIHVRAVYNGCTGLCGWTPLAELHMEHITGIRNPHHGKIKLYARS